MRPECVLCTVGDRLRSVFQVSSRATNIRFLAHMWPFVMLLCVRAWVPKEDRPGAGSTGLLDGPTVDTSGVPAFPSFDTLGGGLGSSMHKDFGALFSPSGVSVCV
jgi:hypothetical protein